jgi:hypothetical protein
MAHNPVDTVERDAPDLGRRRTILRIASATAAAATAIYMAPVIVRIDEAEAKGSKRKRDSKRKGPSRRWKVPSRRRRGTARRRSPSRRRWF